MFRPFWVPKLPYFAPPFSGDQPPARLLTPDVQSQGNRDPKLLRKALRKPRIPPPGSNVQVTRVWCEFLVFRLPENEHTPWKINIEAEKDGLEDQRSIQSGSAVAKVSRIPVSVEKKPMGICWFLYQMEVQHCCMLLRVKGVHGSDRNDRDRKLVYYFTYLRDLQPNYF